MIGLMLCRPLETIAGWIFGSFMSGLAIGIFICALIEMSLNTNRKRRTQ